MQPCWSVLTTRRRACQAAPRSPMAELPAISVLLPYRYAAPTLAAALESTLAQREVALELIALDDGSRDQGPAIAAQFARADARVRLLRSPGIGIARALMQCATTARAPFLARM